MKLINLTPHSFDYAPADKYIDLEKRGSIFVAKSVSEVALSIPSSGEARISVTTEEVPCIVSIELGIPTYCTKYGEITGIPEDVEDEDILIVSLMLQSAAHASGHPLANQMVSPYGVVRDAANTSNVLGCQGITW